MLEEVGHVFHDSCDETDAAEDFPPETHIWVWFAAGCIVEKVLPGGRFED